MKPTNKKTPAANQGSGFAKRIRTVLFFAVQVPLILAALCVVLIVATLQRGSIEEGSDW